MVARQVVEPPAAHEEARVDASYVRQGQDEGPPGREPAVQALEEGARVEQVLDDVEGGDGVVWRRGLEVLDAGQVGRPATARDGDRAG